MKMITVAALLWSHPELIDDQPRSAAGPSGTFTAASNGYSACVQERGDRSYSFVHTSCLLPCKTSIGLPLCVQDGTALPYIDGWSRDPSGFVPGGSATFLCKNRSTVAFGKEVISYIFIGLLACCVVNEGEEEKDFESQSNR